MINGPVWNESDLALNNEWPTVLAIGDSWFWYPFNNLLNRIHRILNENSQNVILVRGHNGAEAVEYVGDAHIRRTIIADLDKKLGYGKTLRAVLVSGGGNDFAGYDDLGGLLLDDCSQAKKPADCFKSGQPDALFAKVASAIGELAALVKAELGDGVPVLVHSYDYPIPTGKGFLGNAQWLKAPMDAHKVPGAMQQALMKLAIDAHVANLQAMSATHKNLVVVDTRDTLEANDWANELHPTMAGFEKIAKHWEPTLKTVGLA
ncbi:MAG: SGNH/GDSL hydrolase family protein [Rhodocyclaceae bacterium]|nr:SGNH/GDSL hydrolase family protein [Rhodocyclaceae bacterium]